MKISYKQAIKRILLAIVAVLVLLIGMFCYFYVPNPLKITDPYHPWFKPDKFRFEDYSSDCMEKEVLAKLFPVGTDKKFVERVLVNAGGASADKLPERVDYGLSADKLPEHVGYGQNAYSYFHKHRAYYIWFFPATTNVAVQYNEKDKVVDVRLSGDSVYDFYEDCKFGKHYGYGEAWK